MAINPVSSGLYSNYLTDIMAGAKSESSETTEVADNILSNYKSTKNAYSAYGSNMYSGVGQSAMTRAIEELKEANGGKITFSMVKEHRASLEEEFKLNVQVGLALLGFEETEDFQLMANSAGEVEIMCEDPALKEAVDLLLKETKDLKSQFLYIQALGNIEQAKSTVSSYWQNVQGKSSLQADAMDILLNGSNFSGQMNSLGVGYSSLLANFNTESAQYTMGANYLV